MRAPTWETLAFAKRGDGFTGHGAVKLHRATCHFVTDSRVKYEPVTFAAVTDPPEDLAALVESLGVQLCRRCFPCC